MKSDRNFSGRSIFALAGLFIFSVMQTVVFDSISQQVMSTFNKPIDRVVVLTTEVSSQQHPSEITRRIATLPGVRNVGWSRAIAMAPSGGLGAVDNKTVKVMEVSASYGEIVLADAMNLEECGDCSRIRAALSDEFQTSKDIAHGSEVTVLGSSLTMSGRFTEPIRGRVLAQSLLVPVGVFAVEQEKTTQVSIAVELDQRPVNQDLKLFAAMLNSAAPAEVQVEAALVEGSASSSILERISASSSILSKAVVFGSAISAFSFGYFGVQRQKYEVALLRSLGASNRFLYLRVAKVSMIHVFVAAIVAMLSISLLQPLLVGLAESSYVPARLLNGLAVSALLSTLFVVSSVISLRSVIGKDPAEVLRSI